MDRPRLPRWLYYNPDTGTEMSADHPVQSGECPDAEDIRPATKENLAKALREAWKMLEEARHG
jgi:hypothetical protein